MAQTFKRGGTIASSSSFSDSYFTKLSLSFLLISFSAKEFLRDKQAILSHSFSPIFFLRRTHKLWKWPETMLTVLNHYMQQLILIQVYTCFTNPKHKIVVIIFIQSAKIHKISAHKLESEQRTAWKKGNNSVSCSRKYLSGREWLLCKNVRKYTDHCQVAIICHLTEYQTSIT